MSGEKAGFNPTATEMARGDFQDLGHEQKKPREMSRVFVFQSKTTDQIRAELASGKTPDQLSFINLIFAEKSTDSISPNQLLPVGGSKRPGDKSSLDTAKRRMLEETHLRPINIQKLGNMDYDLKDPRKEEPENISATYYLAEVLPLDVAYSLNPQEDKIAGYHQIDLSTYRDEILQRGYHTVDVGSENERKLPLIDSLRVAYKAGAQETSPNIIENISAQDVFQIQGKLVEELENKDFAKNQKILRHLVSLLDMDKHAIEYWEDEIDNAKNIIDTSKILKDLLAYAVKEVYGGDASAVQDLFLAAFDLSNFEEEISEKHAGRSHNEMVLRVVFSLLESKYNYDNYIELVKTNPDLANFANRLEKFINILSSDKSATDERQNLAHQLKGLDEVDPELVEEAFFEAFFDFIPKNAEGKKQFERRINKTLSAIDSLLDEKIVRSKLAPIVRDQYNERLLTQVGEIRNANIFTLMKYALPGVGLEEKRRFKADQDQSSGPQDKNMLHRVVFEARRKLAMLFLLLETDEYYDEVIYTGTQEIQELWNDILEPPKVNCYLVEERNEDNELVNIETQFTMPESGNAQTMAVRPFKDKIGNTTMLVGQTGRRKERESLFRKMIVRGYDRPEDVKDINGRSLVIMPAKDRPVSDILKKEERVIEVCGKDNNGRLLCEDKNFEDHVAVLNIIEGLQKNKHVKILEYKPTNEPGTTFASGGAGGDGKIRLAKFYIQHTDSKGVIRTEEVQVFSPSADGHSGFYWEKKKKEDDENYDFERLLRTKGIHSFVEILFPARIYGKPIQNVNKKKRS